MSHPLAPDPVSGVFATMLVVDGRPVELDAHLVRLGASVRALYGAELPAAAATAVAETADPFPLARLRLTVVPAADGEPRVEAVAQAVDRTIVLPRWTAPLELASVTVEGWRGAHKWADRRLLEQLDAQIAPAAALLVDPVAGVLETTRANVFAVGRDGVLWTPPADGSILPGITRARVIELARECGFELREEPLPPERLLAASEVFTTGSIRGVEPVRAIDGVELGAAGAVTEALTDALERYWLAAFGAGPPAT